MPSIETYQLVLAAVAASEDKKAEDIRILALDPTESGLSDYFLICNGTNERQNVAITDEIEIRLKRDFGVYPNSVEGRRQGEWVLMDYVDFIVHVFSAEKRQYYGLERLRKSATTVSVDDLSSELKAEIVASRERASAAKARVPKTNPEKLSSVKSGSKPDVSAKSATAKSAASASSPRSTRSTATVKAGKKTAAKRTPATPVRAKKGTKQLKASE